MASRVTGPEGDEPGPGMYSVPEAQPGPAFTIGAKIKEIKVCSFTDTAARKSQYTRHWKLCMAKALIGVYALKNSLGEANLASGALWTEWSYLTVSHAFRQGLYH
eukprot:scaffold432205_cov36-Prasinocladus_malaysianus.AAC.1